MQDRYSKLKQAIDKEIIDTFNMAPLVNGLNMLCGYQLGFCDESGREQEVVKGKYVRPIICAAVCEAMGGDYERIIPAAASIELIHRTSLVFDDIQDNGRERNQRPTLWSVWGTAQAINAGLALSCYARMSLYRLWEMGAPDYTVLRMWMELEKSVLHLCQGQYWDIDMTDNILENGVEMYMNIIAGKTAALFQVACLIGVLGASAFSDEDFLDDIPIAERFGLNLGVLFQMHDDYLGIWGSEEVGKTANDLTEKKLSLPVLLAMRKDMVKARGFRELGNPEEFKKWMESIGIPEEVKSLEKFYRDQAEDMLNLFPQNEATDHLRAMIAYFMARDR